MTNHLAQGFIPTGNDWLQTYVRMRVMMRWVWSC